MEWGIACVLWYCTGKPVKLQYPGYQNGKTIKYFLGGVLWGTQRSDYPHHNTYTPELAIIGTEVGLVKKRSPLSCPDSFA